MTNEMKRQAGILSFVLICAGIGSLNAQTDSKETTYQARIVLTHSDQTGTTASNTIEEVFAFNDLMNAAEKTSSSNSENVNGKIEDKFAFSDLMNAAEKTSSSNSENVNGKIEEVFAFNDLMNAAEETSSSSSENVNGKIEDKFAFNDLMSVAEKTSSASSENVNGKIEDKFAFYDLMKEAKLISSFAGRKFFVKLSSDRLTVALDREDNVVEVFNIKKTISDKDSSVLICEDGPVLGLQKRNGQLYVTFPGGIEMELSEY